MVLFSSQKDRWGRGRWEAGSLLTLFSSLNNEKERIIWMICSDKFPGREQRMWTVVLWCCSHSEGSSSVCPKGKKKQHSYFWIEIVCKHSTCLFPHCFLVENYLDVLQDWSNTLLYRSVPEESSCSKLWEGLPKLFWHLSFFCNGKITFAFFPVHIPQFFMDLL